MGFAERQVMQLNITKMWNLDQLQQERLNELDGCTFHPKIIVKA